MNENEPISGFAPGEECARCGGRCCRERGCSLSPQDLPENIYVRLQKCVQDPEMQKELFLEVLQDPLSLYAVDQSSSLFYLRMRTKCFTYIGVEAFGECIALTENGCKLPFENRPRGGRELLSSPDLHCKQHYTLEQMQMDWAPYQKALQDIYVSIGALMQEDGTIEQCEKAYFEWMKARRH